MALAHAGDGPPGGCLFPPRLQRGLQPGPGGGRRRRAPHPHARRPALGRRHQLHAGPCGRAGHAADPGADLRGPARGVRSEPGRRGAATRDLQGLRHPWPLRRGDRRRHRVPRRPRVRAGAGRDAREADRRAARGAGPGHADRGARDGPPCARGARRRRLRGAGRRDGRDRDALFPGRLAPARRRRDGHRLPQPQGLHRRQAGPRGRAGVLGRRRHRRDPPADRSRACPIRPAAARSRRSTCTTSSSSTPSRSSTPTRSARCKVVVDGGNGMARPDGRPDPRAAGARPRDHLLDAGRRVPGPRAEPAAPGEPQVRHRPGSGRGGRPGDRLGRGRRPLLLHRRQRGRSSTATS